MVSTAVYRTDVLISAVDINENGTHAVLAGKDILKIVRVHDRSVSDDFDVRKAVDSYALSQNLRADELHKRREYLSAKDVRWSHRQYSHIIATAAQNGRIALYDVSRLSPRIVLHHMYPHNNQVNKLDFDPHSGYMLLSGSQDKWCRVWDIRGPDEPRGHGQYSIRAPVRDVRWCPTDAFEFALCTEEGSVQKWDIRYPQHPLINISKAHEKACYTLAWHPDGKHVATGSQDKSVKVWDLRSDHLRISRQKPLFQIRCPAGVMNLAWRPPCWSAELAERGKWQSTQIATSYTGDDPRLHVWDFRRTSIPFKELNQDIRRPTDFLWASKDLIWTVSEGGSFVQNDMMVAEKPEDSLPPGAVTCAADGTIYAVTTERSIGEEADLQDPAAIFLNIPQERLSGTEDGMTSRSLTDEEGADPNLSLVDHSSRRQSKAASARSVKSQANTPPTHDYQHKTLLPLDKAVAAAKGIFVGNQIGAVSQIPGIYTSKTLTAMVAQYYGYPLSAEDRQLFPDKIFFHLDNVFTVNADEARDLGLPEDAKKWDMAKAVVLYELRIWADTNRKERFDQEEAQRIKRDDTAKSIKTEKVSSPFYKSSQDEKYKKTIDKHEKDPGKPFLRGPVDPKKILNDLDSHVSSNMTTPRQQPVQSPASSAMKPTESTWFSLDDTIDPIQPLPSSLLASHSTANVASQALLSTVKEPAVAHRVSPVKTDNYKRTNAERRAALRDYRAPARQPFTLDSPIVNQKHNQETTSNSAESFSMFPASSSSSNKGSSLLQSGEILNSLSEDSSKSRQDSVNWAPRDGYYDSIGHSEPSFRSTQLRKDSEDSQIDPFTMDESPSPAFGLDGTAASKPTQPGPTEVQFRNTLQQRRSVATPAPKAPELEPTKPISIPPVTTQSRPYQLYASEPINHLNNQIQEIDPKARMLVPISPSDPSRKIPYIISDFRPIDITKYVPFHPWPMTVYCKISAMIESEVQKASNTQFAAHLLTHLYPFFFHQSTARKPTTTDLLNRPSRYADMLIHPAFRQRAIEALFSQHIEYLAKLGLHTETTEFRNLVVEDFGFTSLAEQNWYVNSAQTKETLNTDQRKLKLSCATCGQLMPSTTTTGANASPRANINTCPACGTTRSRCPVCEEPFSEQTTHHDAKKSRVIGLSAYCQVCGHSGHLSCMQEWFTRSDMGECPTDGCGCDCVVGLARDRRVSEQVERRERDKEVRASVSRTSLKKDPLRAETSPAAAAARSTLRRRSSGGDERTVGSGAWAKDGASAGRRVRLKVPDK